MNSEDVRKMVSQKVNEEKRTGNLAAELSLRVGSEDCQTILDFITQYVKQTPDILNAIYTAARNNNMLDQFQPVFNAIFGYWGEEYDFIPDNMGLAGICDDAYLSLCLTQKIADTMIPGTNQKLFGIDIRDQNSLMRQLIGEPIASQLDQAIATTYQTTQLQDFFGQLLSTLVAVNQFPIGNIDSSLSRYNIEREVDVRLGAMGVV